MSAVAAQKFGISCFNGASVSDDHKLHLALIDIDQNIGASVCVQEKNHSEEGHLKLRTGPNEGTAHRFNHSMPRELQVQHMVVLVRQIMMARFESFVIQVSIFLLEVKLDPVVKTNQFISRSSLSDKNMLKATRVQLRVPLAVVHVEPDQIQLILELSQVRAAQPFIHQVLMCTLHDWCLHYCVQELADLQKFLCCDLFSHTCRPLIVIQKTDQPRECGNILELILIDVGKKRQRSVVWHHLTALVHKSSPSLHRESVVYARTHAVSIQPPKLIEEIGQFLV